MIRILLIVFLTLLLKNGLAQQDPQFSQYMYNQTDFNPGSAGNKDDVYSMAALSRKQWVGLEGAPSTSVFTASAPIKPFKINSGLGLTLLSDNLGFSKNVGIKLAYAYKMDVSGNSGNGKLGIGLSGGIVNSAFNATWKPPLGASAEDDNSIPGPNDSGTAFDLGLGLFYHTDNVYMGLSATNLLESKIDFRASKGSFANKRTFYVNSGYSLALKNPQFDIQPSVLIVTDLSASSIDLNTVVMYNKRIWGGVTYRVSSAFIGMVGIELLNGLRVGYSYDFSASDLYKYNNGTHELMIGYNFTLVKEKIPHKNKSVRFL